MDEKKVELTDEEIAEEIVKALVNTKKSLEDLHEDDDDYDKLSLLKKINNSSLWLIQRLQDENERLKIQVMQGLRDMKLEVGIRDKEIKRLEEENEKLKTLVSHFEQLEKQLSAEIERLKNESNEMFDRHSMENQAASLLIEKRNNEIDELQKQVDELKNRFENKACCTMSENCSMVQQAVKDTADKIYDFVKEYYSSDEDIFGERLKEFIEQYGVEVE